MQKKAVSILPNRFEDKRHEIIEAGLRAAGYDVVRAGTPSHRQDILVTWTRHAGGKNNQATAFERAGGSVLVCEEGYFRRVNGEKCFSLALHDHNGAGFWAARGPERWAGFNIDLDPWKMSGDYILVCEQRGIGSPANACPTDWHGMTMDIMPTIFDLPVVLRAHPKTRKLLGLAASQPSMEDHLANAAGVVIWNTAFGVHALRAGVPVISSAPHFILGSACSLKGWLYDSKLRLESFETMAWAQWSVSEIESGQAFDHLLCI